jgi:hypothetical protein
MNGQGPQHPQNLYENLYAARGLSRRSIKWIIAM